MRIEWLLGGFLVGVGAAVPWLVGRVDPAIAPAPAVARSGGVGAGAVAAQAVFDDVAPRADDRGRGDAGGAAASEIRTEAQRSWRAEPTSEGRLEFVQWPGARRTRVVRSGNRSADPADEPSVPTGLAFRALWYLGAESSAERTWSRAVNDPNHPPGVRSDLIADLVDEGYTDNSHPGLEDLPLIRARLDILERHAPHALDDVNARAFEQTYRQLLSMYQRLLAEAELRGASPGRSR